MRRTKGKLLLSRSLAGCVTLVAMKGLLHHISCRDWVPPSKVTCRVFASTWSGDLVSSSLDLGLASFDLETWLSWWRVWGRRRKLISWVRWWITSLLGVPSPQNTSEMWYHHLSTFLAGFSLVGCRCLVLWGLPESPLHPSCKCEEDGGVSLTLLESCGAERRRCSRLKHPFQPLPCLA